MAIHIDPDHFIGLPVEQAKAQAKEQGIWLRVVAEDGKENIVTMDLRGNRLNAIVEQGVVRSFRTSTAVDGVTPSITW